MAVPNNVQNEGCDGPGYSSSSGNSAMYNNDDNGIFDVNPDQKQTPGMAYSQNPQDNDIIAEINQTSYNEPGSTQNTNKITTGETMTNSDIDDMPDLPKTPLPDIHTTQYESNSYTAYNERIHSAITSLKSEINTSDIERKENEILIDQQFDDIIKTLMTRKFQIIKDMNLFYDNQKQQSLKRITELTTEFKQNKIKAAQEHKEEIARQRQLKKEEEEKAIIEKNISEQKSNNNCADDTGMKPPILGFKRLSIFGNTLKSNASKLAVGATKFAETAGKEVLKAKDVTSNLFDTWLHVDKSVFVEEKDLYFKHEKVRLAMPKDDLVGLIENKIKLTTEWWSSVSLNHILFKIKDNELWRTNDINGGWFNAFGTMKVRRGQIKRWNIKVCGRVQQGKVGQQKKHIADVVFGIVESYRAKPQDKPGGFWVRPCKGFGVYGYNGKIFHMKNQGKMYCEPLCVGQTIGIELNMKPTLGMDNNDKEVKPKMYLKNSKIYGLGGGVVKFYVDDEDLGIAFYDLDLKKQYSLAVALNSNAYTLQLCD